MKSARLNRLHDPMLRYIILCHDEHLERISSRSFALISDLMTKVYIFNVGTFSDVIDLPMLQNVELKQLAELTPANSSVRVNSRLTLRSASCETDL